MKLTKSFKDDKPFNSSMLEVGEMMKCTEIDNHYGEILLRIYGDTIVSLNTPGSTWSGPSSLSGRKLLPGESVTLTQE